MRIDQQHLDHLAAHGYAVVPGVLSRREVKAGLAEVLRYFPTAGELTAAPQRYETLMEQSAYLQVEFPFIGDTLNHVATHPSLVDAARRLIGTDDVVLSQSAIWAKYADTDTYGTDLHVDYEGNTLVVPREEGDYRQLNAILYYTDMTPDLGPTYIVPTDHTEGLPLWPPHRPREKYRSLYRHEIPILCPAGSALLFTMSTFHRASPVTNPQAARFSHHFVFRSVRHAFAGYHLWSRFGERPELQHFITHATPEQRSVIGFPPPGHDYWTPQTLAGVTLRYPGMDLNPYRKALKSKAATAARK